MTHPLCLLRGLWRSLRTLLSTGIPTSGHVFREDYSGPGYISVLKCECCGKYDVAWSKEPQ